MSSDTANQSSCKQPLGRFHTGRSYSLVGRCCTGHTLTPRRDSNSRSRLQGGRLQGQHFPRERTVDASLDPRMCTDLTGLELRSISAIAPSLMSPTIVITNTPPTAAHPRICRSSSSFGRTLFNLPAGSGAWAATMRQVPASPATGMRRDERRPMTLCPGQLSMLAGPLAEHGEFGRFRVRRNGYELDVARGPDSLARRR